MMNGESMYKLKGMSWKGAAQPLFTIRQRALGDNRG